MTEKVVGTVEVITKNKWGFFNTKIGEDWYGTGEKEAPAFDRGDTIEVEIETNERGFKNFAKGTAKVVAKADSKPAPKKSGGYKKSSGGSGDDWDVRQKQISWQASRNTAIELVKVLLEQGAIPVPPAKKDKAPAIEEYVNRYTNKFFASTQALSTEVEGFGDNNSGSDDLSGEED